MSFDEQYDRPPVTFVAAGDNDEERNETLESVENSKGYFPASVLISRAIERLADLTMLDFTKSSAAIRYQIDGVWQTGSALERESGDHMLAAIKHLAGMDYRERRKRQSGKFAAEFKKFKYKIKVVSQGVSTGERVLIYLTWKKEVPETLEDLGMRASLIARFKEVVRTDSSSIMMAAGKPREGYTSVWKGMMNACDRLTRDFYVIEDEPLKEEEVINVGSIVYHSDKGETLMTPMPALLLREPSVIAFTDLPDGDTVNQICKLSTEHDLPVFTRHRGNNAFDAIDRVLALGPDRKAFIKLLDAVLCMRTVRKLCLKCRQEYAPSPGLLAKLKLPPGRVPAIYRPTVHREGSIDENGKPILPCKACFGYGYQGLTGVFELLLISDAMKEAMLQGAPAAKVAPLAAENRHVSLLQEAAVLVAAGTTSVEELQRMLTAK